AEDGIRDWSVTGVQTCALPIWKWSGRYMVCPWQMVERERSRPRSAPRFQLQIQMRGNRIVDVRGAHCLCSFSPFRGRRSASSMRSEEHTSELQSLTNLVCRLLL